MCWVENFLCPCSGGTESLMGVISVHPSLRGTQAPPTYTKSQAGLLFPDRGKLPLMASPSSSCTSSGWQLSGLRARGRLLTQASLCVLSESHSLFRVCFLFWHGLAQQTTPTLNLSSLCPSLQQTWDYWCVIMPPLASASDSSSSYPFSSSSSFSSSLLNTIFCSIMITLSSVL